MTQQQQPLPLTDEEKALAEKIAAELAPPSLETMERARLRIARARTQLLLEPKFIFWATCALHLRPTPFIHMRHIARGAIGTDGTNLLYDPVFIAGDTWDDEQLLGVIAHEVSHAVKGDNWRRGQRDPGKWNLATDARIDPELLRAGLKLPSHGSPFMDILLQNPANYGRSAEALYPEMPESDEGECESEGGGGQGQGQSDPMAGDCRDPSSGQGQQSPQQRQDQAEALERRWELIARQAANIAKAQGHLPSGYEHLVEPVRPHLDPYALLRHFVSMCRKDDYSWSRGNRRYAYQGIYLPSLWSEGIGEIIIAADVSGSTAPVWPLFAGFLNACLEEVKPEKVHFVECDAAVHAVTEFGPGESLPDHVAIHGGGGTDMRPIWEWAAEHNIHPVCAIVLSDMEMDDDSFGDQSLIHWPVLWVSSEAGRIAPFGETVELMAP